MRKTTINGVEIKAVDNYGKPAIQFYDIYQQLPLFRKKHIPKLISVLQTFLNEKPTKKTDKANYLKARAK